MSGSFSLTSCTELSDGDVNVNEKNIFFPMKNTDKV